MKFDEWKLKLHIYARCKKSTESRSVSALDQHFHIRVYLPHTSTPYLHYQLNSSDNVGTPVGNAQLLRILVECPVWGQGGWFRGKQPG